MRRSKRRPTLQARFQVVNGRLFLDATDVLNVFEAMGETAAANEIRKQLAEVPTTPADETAGHPHA
jgi:hypothetical protein